MRQIVPKLAWVIITGGICFSSMAAGRPDPIAEKGILDLRNYDLFTRPVTLNGEWGFFWKELLTPDSLRPARTFVSYSKLWNDLRLNGQPLSPQGYATYTLKILLPRTRPWIALDIQDVYCAYKLYVNGKVEAQNGETGRSVAEARPFWTRSTVALPKEIPDTLTLLLQISNFWHAKGGPDKPIQIGDKDKLFLEKNQSAAYDFILTGCFLMGGLFFLGLYLFGRHDLTALYFSLFCILYSYRRIGTGSYALYSVFTDLNPFYMIKVEYLALTEGVALSFLYTRSLYPEETNPVMIRIMVWFCHLYSLLIIFTAPILFSGFLNIFLATMFLCLAYIVWVYVNAARKHRSGSLYALLGAAVMIVLFLLQDLNYFGLIPPLQSIHFTGYIAFFFFQSLALSHRFAENFKQATALAQQGLRTKSEFLSTMSHEIRTPLNAVIGMTHLLLRDDPRTDQKEKLNLQLFSANNLLSIVNNILDYNKIEEGKVGFERIPMDLADIARNILAGLKAKSEEKGIELSARIDERLERKLIGDPTRTGQVIGNLVQNAVKFTSKGFVRLSLHADHISAWSVSVTIMVEDTGIGIPQEKQRMIFDRFTQADSSTSRSFGGTGLGLAITKRILELQGVDLQLKSEPGEGALFYFTQTFSLYTEEGIKLPEPDEVLQHDEWLKDLCILLVEDKRLNILVVKTMLEGSGAIVDVATSGLEALEKLDPTRHQLVLMDLQMPGMDGYQATIQLRKRGETLPIIALTASSREDVEKQALAAGITAVITKPIDPPDLYRMILQYII